MKFFIGILAIASSTLALTTGIPELLPNSQCQGENCQDNQADAAPIQALVRDFVSPWLESTASSLAAPETTDIGNHLAVDNMPVFELLYNYINPESSVPLAEKVKEEPAVNRLETFLESAETTNAPVSSSVVDQQPQEAEESFDFNSWGQRVDNAAHKLVSNVGAVIVQFLPTTTAPLSSAMEEEEASSSATNNEFWF